MSHFCYAIHLISVIHITEFPVSIIISDIAINLAASLKITLCTRKSNKVCAYYM